MKIPVFVCVCMLFALSFASPRADATPPAGRTSSPKTTAMTAKDMAVKEKLVISHIKQKLGPAFADPIVTDVRFTIDPELFRRNAGVGKGKPTPRLSKKPNYDYVFNEWSREKGKQFLETNKDAFVREEELFGVPREFINGILNIETQWGRALGKRLVVTTLYTFAVMRPTFQKPGWPEEQLIAFLAICKNSGVDPFSVKGSHTGAFGLPQFEPTSYPAVAVRCRADAGPPDLFNEADAICSIGKYLHRAGWGASEASRKKALRAYIHDPVYADAVLDYGDSLLGKPLKHPRYRLTQQK